MYDKKEDGPRFVFHTAFDDPTSEVGAPDRESIEIRAIVCFEEPEQKGVFYDNGDLRSATIKLWIKLKGIGHLVDIKAAKKCSFKTEKGNQLTDTNIIMQYLEDKFGHLGAPLMPEDPEKRAMVNLIVRMHDIYISSPNCS